MLFRRVISQSRINIFLALSIFIWSCMKIDAANQYWLPECRTVPHPVSPVPDWKKLTMQELVRYRNKTTQSGIFLLRYRTEMTDTGIPMPALVFWMPMPTYGNYRRLITSSNYPPSTRIGQEYNHVLTGRVIVYIVHSWPVRFWWILIRYQNAFFSILLHNWTSVHSISFPCLTSIPVARCLKFQFLLCRYKKGCSHRYISRNIKKDGMERSRNLLLS
jgi:hypothetical protein